MEVSTKLRSPMWWTQRHSKKSKSFLHSLILQIFNRLKPADASAKCKKLSKKNNSLDSNSRQLWSLSRSELQAELKSSWSLFREFKNETLDEFSTIYRWNRLILSDNARYNNIRTNSAKSRTYNSSKSRTDYAKRMKDCARSKFLIWWAAGSALTGSSPRQKHSASGRKSWRIVPTLAIQAPIRSRWRIF